MSQSQTNLKQNNKTSQNLHNIFESNPDLLEFAIHTNILERLNNLLLENTTQSKESAKNLILNTEYPQDLLDELNSRNADNKNMCFHQTLIIGNGDVMNRDEGIQKAVETGVDGVMIGRGIFKDPWAFLSRSQAMELDTKQARLNLLLEHLVSWETVWQGQKNFPAMKKFVKMYINSFDGASDMRGQFMELNTASDMIIMCQKELTKC